MDDLASLGLRIDENEKLRILSEETERGSADISKKTKLLMSNLSQLGERLDKTIGLLKTLDEQTEELRVQKLAERISKLQSESK